MEVDSVHMSDWTVVGERSTNSDGSSQDHAAEDSEMDFPDQETVDTEDLMETIMALPCMKGRTEDELGDIENLISPEERRLLREKFPNLEGLGDPQENQQLHENGTHQPSEPDASIFASGSQDAESVRSEISASSNSAAAMPKPQDDHRSNTKSGDSMEDGEIFSQTGHDSNILPASTSTKAVAHHANQNVACGTTSSAPISPALLRASPSLSGPTLITKDPHADENMDDHDSDIVWDALFQPQPTSVTKPAPTAIDTHNPKPSATLSELASSPSKKRKSNALDPWAQYHAEKERTSSMAETPHEDGVLVKNLRTNVVPPVETVLAVFEAGRSDAARIRRDSEAHQLFDHSSLNMVPPARDSDKRNTAGAAAISQERMDHARAITRLLFDIIQIRSARRVLEEEFALAKASGSLDKAALEALELQIFGQNHKLHLKHTELAPLLFTDYYHVKETLVILERENARLKDEINAQIRVRERVKLLDEETRDLREGRLASKQDFAVMKAELDELKKKMGGEGGTTNRGWQTSNGGGGVYGTGANRGGYGEGGWRGGRGRGRGGGYGGGGGGGQRGGFDRDTGTSPQYTAVAAWSSPAVAGGEQWPSVTAPAGDVSSATPAQQNSSGNATATVMADTQPPTETGVTSGPAAWGQPVVSTDATTGGWGTITSTADAEAWPASQPWS